MRLFDLHVDTPTKLYRQGLAFTDPTLQLSAEDLPSWEHLTQVFACFSSPASDNDAAYEAFFPMRERLLAEIAPYHDRVTAILAVEDARLLGSSRERLIRLFESGVRILTLVWRGTTQLGGAYDTALPLTPFGREILSDCFALGIHPDVSHASDAVFADVAEEAAARRSPFLATHSNSRAVCQHPRNLTDDQFCAVMLSGGLVGLSLYPPHLSGRSEASSRDVLRHLEHWMALGGERTVAIGSDFDGIDTTPTDLTHNRHLHILMEEMARLGYTEELIKQIMYQNAENYFGRRNRQETP